MLLPIFPETPQNSPSKSGEFQSVDLHGEAPLSPPVPSAGGRSRRSSTSSITSDTSSLFPIFESPVLNSFSLQVGCKNLTVFEARLQNYKKWLLASLCLSGSSPVDMEEPISHWMNFHEISVKKIQGSLKSDKNNGYFTWRRPVYIYDHNPLSSSRYGKSFKRKL